MSNRVVNKTTQTGTKRGPNNNNFVRFQDLLDIQNSLNDLISPSFYPTTVTSNLTVSMDYEIYLIDTSIGNVEITLPSTSTSKFWYFIKTTNTNQMILTPSSGTINGEVSVTITGAFDSIKVISDTSNYYIL